MTKSLAERLTGLVELELGGNWAELGRRAGLTPSTLQQLKNGSDPRGTTLLRLSEGMGVSIDWLMAGREPKRLSTREAADADALSMAALSPALRTALSAPLYMDHKPELMKGVMRLVEADLAKRPAPAEVKLNYLVMAYKFFYLLGLNSVDQAPPDLTESFFHLLRWAVDNQVPPPRRNPAEMNPEY